MGDQAMYVQWQGTQACMDLHCSNCGTHSHIHTRYHMEVACVGCGTRYALGRVQLHDMGKAVGEPRSLAMPGLDDLAVVCESMDAAGGLSEAEKHAVMMVLDCEIGGNDDLPSEDRRAILEWAAKQGGDDG